MVHAIQSPLWIFGILFIVLMALAAIATGQVLANTWRPIWPTIMYPFLLGFADRFLAFALFDDKLLSPFGFVVDTVVLITLCLIGYRLRVARKMVEQYPWLYERAGPGRYRTKDNGARGAGP